MINFPVLKSGDGIEIIAPASRCSDSELGNLKDLLASWGLRCIVNPAIFGDDLLCANSDENRFNLLRDSLNRPDTKAIICARGGYGSLRLLPYLVKIPKPALSKLFLGMSDITALNLYLAQEWHWPVIHGAIAQDRFSEESTQAVKSLLLGSEKPLSFSGSPLNALATKNTLIKAPIIGGNVCIVQTSIGTSWQIQSKNKILFLEETGERGYKIDRMLEHLRQAGIFDSISGLVVGDFIKGDEPNGNSLVNPVLERFASSCPFPVVRIQGIGHDYINFPLPLGIPMALHLGKKIVLQVPV